MSFVAPQNPSSTASFLSLLPPSSLPLNLIATPRLWTQNDNFSHCIALQSWTSLWPTRWSNKSRTTAEAATSHPSTPSPPSHPTPSPSSSDSLPLSRSEHTSICGRQAMSDLHREMTWQPNNSCCSPLRRRMSFLAASLLVTLPSRERGR